MMNTKLLKLLVKRHIDQVSTPEVFAKVIGTSVDKLKQAFRITEDTRVEEYFMACRREFEQRRLDESGELEGATVLDIEQTEKELYTRNLAPPDPDWPPHVQKAYTVLHDNIFAETTPVRNAVKMARTECGNKHSGYALLRKYLGRAPEKRVIECRLDLALRLLRYDQLNLTDVALAVGYDTQNAFATAFRRALHISPGRYRRQFLDY